MGLLVFGVYGSEGNVLGVVLGAVKSGIVVYCESFLFGGLGGMG
jgi:hypothetical protein